MKVARLPVEESLRLDVLHGLRILDTEPEPAFDAVARLAGQQLGCPIALISLIDRERQWFKASRGLDVRETPRDIAFCTHAILQDDVFVVEDAPRDDRFHDNPLVTSSPDIRFYAGAPLQVAGHKLGTLCVIGRVPRRLGDRERNALQDLSIVTSSLLEARLREQRLLDRLLTEIDPVGAPVSDERMNARHQLRAAMFNAVSAHMAILDRRGCILETNAAWQGFAAASGHIGDPHFFGMRYLQVLGQLSDLGPDAAARARAGVLDVLAGRAPTFEMEYRCHTPGHDRWFAMKVTPVGDEYGRVLVSHEEITKHKRAEQELLRLAHSDPLTGVANRRRFFDLAQHEFQRAIRYKGVLAVLMADIDLFKTINDRHGHAAGDEVLRCFVHTAGEALRDTDLIGRLGGEEFAVLLPQTGVEGAHALAERIVERVAATPAHVFDTEIAYTVSVGASALDDAMSSFDDVLRAADQQLYRAKEAGRNTALSSFGDLG